MQVSWDCDGCSSGPPSCSPVFTDILPLAQYQANKRHISTDRRDQETITEKLLIDGLIPFGVQTSQGRDNTTADNQDNIQADDSIVGPVISDGLHDNEDNIFDSGDMNKEEFEGTEEIEEDKLGLSCAKLSSAYAS